MTPDIHVWLDTTPVNDLIDGRVYPFGDAGDSPSYPYVNWQMPSSRTENRLSGAPQTDNDRCQVDCYARTQASAIAVAKAVRDELDKHGHQMVKIIHGRDPETRSYRIQFDYSFWVYR